MRRMRPDMLEPIPEEDREDWEKLIAKTIKLVNSADKSRWELIFLSGTVEKKYGENRLKRWADEAGLSYQQARTYAWLSRKGVDAAFVKKWARTDRNPDGLSYTVIREIAGFSGGVKSPYAEGYLTWAVEHSATGIMVRAYMQETVAPQNARETSHEIAAAIADKQRHEGFNDYIRTQLEGIIAEHPEAEEAVLKTAIVSVDDITNLKLAAGLLSDDEQEMVDQSRRMVQKIRSMRNWLRDNEQEIATNIAYGHEASAELASWVRILTSLATPLASLDVPSFDAASVPAEDVTLPSSTP
jgi:hypothetical protein